MTSEKFETSFALLIDGAVYVIDAGSGAYGRLIQALAKHGDGVAEVDLRHVFLTHLHPDHTLSLPSFIFGPYQLGRQEPISVYGPAGTQAMVDHLIEAYKVGIHELQHHGPREMPSVTVNVTEISSGIIFEDER
ncbi:MAG: MBL fold metallo-hydrolase, partial [Chloroflexota bacterium]